MVIITNCIVLKFPIKWCIGQKCWKILKIRVCYLICVNLKEPIIACRNSHSSKKTKGHCSNDTKSFYFKSAPRIHFREEKSLKCIKNIFWVIRKYPRNVNQQFVFELLQHYKLPSIRARSRGLIRATFSLSILAGPQKRQVSNVNRLNRSHYLMW